MMRIVVFSMIMILSGCSPKPSQLDIPALIPMPTSIEKEDGVFVLNKDTRIVVAENSSEQQKIAHYLRERIHEETGLDLALANTAKRNCIRLRSVSP